MRRIVYLILVVVIIVLLVRAFYGGFPSDRESLRGTHLIQEQISQVSKLIVTEGHFSEVYTYKDSKALFGPLITANKKALVVVNAEVTIGYDLTKLEIQLDSLSKTVRIQAIPPPEINLNPDFEYYDVSADYLNPFSANDYNTIKRNVRSKLMRKVRASSLPGNAQNRLLSELQKFYILTNSLGWTLSYDGRTVTADSDFPLTP